MPHRLKQKVDAATVQARVAELGAAISRDYKGRDLVMVCVLKGAFLFFADLVRQVTIEPEIDFVRLASYGDSTSRGGEMRFTKDLEVAIHDKHVLIVEDIVDSGHSMAYLTHVFAKRGPKSLKICALVDKRERREIDLAVDYPGFEVNGFLVGYGMDYAERYRELNALFELVNE